MNLKLKNRTVNLHLFFSIVLAVFIGFYGIYYADKNAIILDDSQICGIYCLMAQNYDTYLIEKSFSKYYFQKSLFSLVAYLTFTIFQIEPSPININLIFDYINSLLLVLTIIFWFKISQKLSFSIEQYYIGAITLLSLPLFIIFSPFLQEDPDPFALLTAMIFLYFYILGDIKILLVIFFVSNFIQPQFALFTIPLIILRKYDLLEKKSREFTRLKSFKLISFFSNIFSFLHRHKFYQSSVLFLSIFLFLIFTSFIFPQILQPYIYHGRWYGSNFFYIGFLFTIILLFLSLNQLRFFNALSILIKAISVFKIRKVTITILIIYIIKSLIIYIFSKEGQTLAYSSNFKNHITILLTYFYNAPMMPLQPWLAHIAYFGFFSVFLIYHWKEIDKILIGINVGHGLHIVFLLFFVLSVNSESRHLISFLPFLLLIISAIKFVSKKFLVLFSILSVISSRFYVPFDQRTEFILTNGGWWTLKEYYTALSFLIFFTLVLIAYYFYNKNNKRLKITKNSYD